VSIVDKRFKLAFILIIISSLAIMNSPVKSQPTGNIIISSDGSVTGTKAITQSGNTYTLTANITEWIQVQKSNIVIDGAGYAINGAGVDLTNGIGPNQPSPSRPIINNITIRNLIINGDVIGNGGGNYTFYNNYIYRISLGGTMYNNITYCTINDIVMLYGGSFTTITENNILNGVTAFLASNLTVNRNYWRLYLTKYPNATEIGNTGIGNQPFVFLSTPIYQDNHPLMKSVSIPLTGSSIEFPTPVPTPNETYEPIGTPIPPRTPSPTPIPTVTSSLIETPNPTPYTPESQLLPLGAILAVIIPLSASAVLIARKR